MILIWNANFTTVMRFPVTLNADFFVKHDITIHGQNIPTAEGK